jgi:uncharacterized delta-60 repeat protein
MFFKILIFVLIIISNYVVANSNNAPTFNVSDGNLIYEVPPLGCLIDDLALSNDNKIISVGTTGSITQDICILKFNQDGTLDANFSDDGILIKDISELADTQNTDWVSKVLIQNDGKIIVIGHTHIVIDDISYGYYIMLLRFNTDGSLDTSFSDDGVVTTPISNDSSLIVQSAALQPDGKIIVSGFGKYTNSAANYGGLLVRYNSDGSLDHTFSSDGILVDFSISSGFHDLAIHSDGDIYVVGRYGNDGTGKTNIIIIAKYTSDGTIDYNFGTDGWTTVEIGSYDYANSIKIYQNNKILIGGRSKTTNTNTIDFALARFDLDGNLDTSFSTNGIVTTDFYTLNTDPDVIEDILIQSDGKILVGGSVAKTGELGYENYSDYAIARYETNGELDNTFGINGKLSSDFHTYGNELSYGKSIILSSNENIIIGGNAYDRSNNLYNLGLAKYNDTGLPDLTFNKINRLDGIITYSEGQSPTLLDSEVKIYDAELYAQGNYYGATITLLRNGGSNLDDVFSSTGNLSAFDEGYVLTLSGSIIGSIQQNSSGELILKFSSNATQEVVNETLSSIEYSNISNTPESSIQIDWIFNDGNDGTQGDGGALSTTGYTTINISSVNNKPTANDSTIFMGSNLSYTFNINDFNFSDSEDGSTPTAIYISSVPSSGFLKYDGINLIAGIDISGSDILSGKLTYMAENNSGSPSFNFKVKDSASEYSDSTYTLTISFAETSQPPTNKSQIDTSPSEGNSNRVNYFLLELSSSLTVDASVDYKTEDGTAIAGQDYTSTNGVAIITAGDTFTAIGVEIIGDTIAEINETYKLVISNPIGASFPNGISEISVTRTIINDD